ncbi:MAG: hypothetical protein GY737_02925 [Desulfobacteraceae bacterium]|nr:hypothetical protein [Desulfobacteraceae bacterium]
MALLSLRKYIKKHRVLFDPLQLEIRLLEYIKNLSMPDNLYDYKIENKLKCIKFENKKRFNNKTHFFIVEELSSIYFDLYKKWESYSKYSSNKDVFNDLSCASLFSQMYLELEIIDCWFKELKRIVSRYKNPKHLSQSPEYTNVIKYGMKYWNFEIRHGGDFRQKLVKRYLVYYEREYDPEPGRNTYWGCKCGSVKLCIANASSLDINDKDSKKKLEEIRTVCNWGKINAYFKRKGGAPFDYLQPVFIKNPAPSFIERVEVSYGKFLCALELSHECLKKNNSKKNTELMMGELYSRKKLDALLLLYDDFLEDLQGLNV